VDAKRDRMRRAARGGAAGKARAGRGIPPPAARGREPPFPPRPGAPGTTRPLKLRKNAAVARSGAMAALNMLGEGPRAWAGLRARARRAIWRVLNPHTRPRPQSAGQITAACCRARGSWRPLPSTSEAGGGPGRGGDREPPGGGGGGAAVSAAAPALCAAARLPPRQPPLSAQPPAPHAPSPAAQRARAKGAVLAGRQQGRGGRRGARRRF
jgi:hypothetical protein